MHRLRNALLGSALLLAGTTVPAQASAHVVENCYGDLVATIPLVDRDGLQATTDSGVLRAEVYHSEASGGTTCVLSLGGSDSIPRIAMIVAEDGAAVIDHGEYEYHAAVAATRTEGTCVLIYAAAEMSAFGPEAPASTGDTYMLPAGKRSVCV